MKAVHNVPGPRERAAALIIVLAFVVLLTGLVFAYFSRTVTDREVAHGSFSQTKADQLALSAADMIVTDLKQEIVNGSTALTATPAPAPTIFMPNATPNILPMRSGNPSGPPDPLPNLIRRSVRSDPIPSPAPVGGSRASAVNSTTDVSANSRSIGLARWNKHYLLPRYDDTDLVIDSTPPSPLLSPFNPNPPVANGFTPPDWVVVTNQGPTVISLPSQSVIGRYAYAIYDEGGLLDANAAGYPSTSTITQSGRKGSIAYADLTVLPTSTAIPAPTLPPFRVDNMVGWRNYATANPAGNFSNNFTFNAASALNYFSFILSNTTGFMATAGTVRNGRTDQAILTRQELINLRSSLGTSPPPVFSQNVLQYLGTFSRELNSPSYSPPTPPGSSIDYATLANTPTAINPNFSLRRVNSTFTRFDGSPAVVGEPLVKTRFPLSRLAWITYKGPSANLATTDPVYTALTAAGVTVATIQAGTAANIKKYFGLTFGGAVGDPSKPWIYTNPTGASAAITIMTLDQVGAASPGREPDFFELLRAAILSGSLGQNTVGGVTGGPVFPDIHMNNTTQHILSIGAAIIDQADPDSIPTRIQFKPSATVWTAYGVESLPYITQLYPIAGTSPGAPTMWATYVLFQLWNPHQNVTSSSFPVRLRVDGNIGIFTGGNGQTWTAGTSILASGQSVILKASASFSTPTPLTSDNTTNAAAPPGVPGTFSALAAPAVPIPPSPLGLVLAGAGSAPPANPNIPVVTGGTASGTVGVVFSPYQIIATAPPQFPITSYGASPLPPGLTVNPSTGVISGTPTAAGTYTVTITATNSKGTGSNTLVITIVNPAPPGLFVGFRLPDFQTSAGSPNNPRLMLQMGAGGTSTTANRFNATLEVDPTGTGTVWIPYNHFVGITDTNPNYSFRDSWITDAPLPVRDSGGLTGAPQAFSTAQLTVSPPAAYMKADPRSTRFGIFQMDTNPTSNPSNPLTSRIMRSIWPSNDSTVPNGYGGAVGVTYPAPVEHAPLRFAAAPYFPATSSINDGQPNSIRNTVTTSYADNDAIIRFADAAYPDPTKTTTGSSTPFYPTPPRDYPPIILNRPFRSVGELGYAFRDLPWKSLDLFTQNSADAGLLDVFSVNDEPAIIAGRVNLNTRQAAGLQAVLAGAIWDELTSSSVSNDTSAGAQSAPIMTDNIVAATSTAPLQNKAALITSAGLPTTILPLPTTSQDNQTVKARRDVVSRAITSVSQTRTWNLLIDVVAQSGRYPPTATTAADLPKFVVEGEQRYWVHVAIDRFTGEVIDRQVEVVKE
jgi:hypothetical protein